MSLSDVSPEEGVWEESYATFLASVRSVGTACTLAAVGTYMHQKGLISVQGKRMLALISQQVTFPLFLFTKIINCNQDWSTESCPSVTGSLKEVWLLLIWPLFVVAAGMLVGRFVSHVCGTPLVQRKVVMAAVAFGNSTGLPITLLTVVHSNFSKTSQLGRVDPTLFLSVFLLLYPVLQWGLGGWLLAPSKEDEEDNEEEQRKHNDKDVEQQALLAIKDEDTLSSRSAEDSTPPLVITTEPGVQPHNNNNESTTAMFTVPSTLKLNVLNNKSDDQHYIRSHQGLYSSDEGMYLSDFNLSAMGGSQSQADLVALQRAYYMERERQQQHPVPSTSSTPSTVGLSSSYSPSSTTLLAWKQVLGASPPSLLLPPPIANTTFITTPNETTNNNTTTMYHPMRRNMSVASTDSAPEYLLYDSLDPTTTTQGTTVVSSSSHRSAGVGGAEEQEEETSAAAEPLHIPLDHHHQQNGGGGSSSFEQLPLLQAAPSSSSSSSSRLLVLNNPMSKSSPAMYSCKTYGSAETFKPKKSSLKPDAAAAAVVVNNNVRSSKSGGDTTTPVLAREEPKPHNDEGCDDNDNNNNNNNNKFKGESVLSTIHTVLERCFQPPVIGAVTGILVAISPLRGLFVDLVDRSGDAPLEWLFDGLYSVGLTAVPINMIILGCNLSNSYNKYVASTSKNPPKMIKKSLAKEAALSMKTLVGIVIGKMIIMPIIGFLSAWFLKTFVLHIPSDISAAFYLVLLIVFLTPTANNVMVMVELSGSNTKEGIANVIALQYAVAPIILSCSMTIAIGYAVSI